MDKTPETEEEMAMRIAKERGIPIRNPTNAELTSSRFSKFFCFFFKN
jgi:hypothetical protein